MSIGDKKEEIYKVYYECVKDDNTVVILARDAYKW